MHPLAQGGGAQAGNKIRRACVSTVHSGASTAAKQCLCSGQHSMRTFAGRYKAI